MKSLGDTLRSAREERRISMDQAVHETNISRTYLEALESEDFTAFPAEAYLIGFLRNYAEFLGIDPDKAVGRFRNYKLSEEPTPIEELVGPPKGAAVRKVLLWCGAALVLAAAGFSIPRLAASLRVVRQERAARIAEAEAAETEPAREIRPAAPLWEGEVRSGDTLRLEGLLGETMIALSGGEERLELDAGAAGSWSMLLGEEIYIPGADGRPEWRIYLKDIGLQGGGAVVEVQQLAPLDTEEAVGEPPVQLEPPSGASERRREARVILSAPRPDRFTMDFALRDFALLRYRLDGGEAVEAYYGEGDGFRLDVSRGITVWVSNGGALYADIGNEEVVFGRRGEVAAKRIRWVLNEERGEYDLTLLPLY